MLKNSVDHMRTASYLLPDPGGEVVRELLDEIVLLRSALNQKTERQRIMNRYIHHAAEDGRHDTHVSSKRCRKWCRVCEAKKLISGLPQAGYPDERYELSAALKLALVPLRDYAEATHYVGDDDEIGEHVCCGALSYSVHNLGCRAEEALKAIMRVAPLCVEEPA